MKATTRRILGGIAGGFVGSIAYVAYRLFTSEIHIGSMTDIILLPLPGLVGEAILGAIYPKPFAYLAGLILNLWPS